MLRMRREDHGMPGAGRWVDGAVAFNIYRCTRSAGNVGVGWGRRRALGSGETPLPWYRVWGPELGRNGCPPFSAFQQLLSSPSAPICNQHEEYAGMPAVLGYSWHQQSACLGRGVPKPQ